MLIYTITNSATGKKYVGKTIFTLDVRMSAHKSAAKTKNFPLYNAFKKYGIDSFIIEQIDEATTVQELNIKEISWISQLDTIVPNGYNVRLGGNGGSAPGSISESGRRRIGEAARQRMTGRTVSKETKEKLRRNATGVVFSEERKCKISRSKQGKNGHPAWNKGNHASTETRAKMSAAQKGKHHAPYARKPHSKETKVKMSAAHKGRPSQLKGRKFLEDRRKRQSEAIKLWHQRRLTPQ